MSAFWAVVGGLYLFAVCGAALWKGDWPERVGACAMLAASFATPFVVDTTWSGAQLGELAVDTALLIVLLGLVFATRRWWPLWASGFQLVGVAVHASDISGHINTYTYLTGIVIWSYLVIFALAVGTWSAWRNRKAEGQSVTERA